MKFLKFADDDEIVIIDVALILKYRSEGEGKTRIIMDAIGEDNHVLPINIEELVKRIGGDETEIIPVGYFPTGEKPLDTFLFEDL